MKYVVWLWRNTVGIRWNMLLRIVAGLGRVVLGLLMVWLCKQFIDVSIRTGSDSDIVLMVVYIVAVVIGGIICRQVYYYWGVKAEAIQSTSIRLCIFSHLFLRQMFDQKEMHSGDISSRLQKDISTVSSATTSIIPDLCVTLFQLFGAFMLMQVMDERLAWVLLLLTPAFILIGKLVAWKIRKMTQDIRQQESVIQMLVQESMEHNMVLRSLESGNWVTGQLDNLQQELRGKVNHRAQFTVLFRLLIGLSFSMGYIVAFIWGGLQLKDGVITFGVMTSFLQLVSQIQQPILQMVNMMPQMFQASASIDRLEEMEHMEAEEVRQEANGKMEGLLGLDIQDVSFRYAIGDREILKHFTHQFAPGRKTALMGHTGVGKTTLVKTIARATDMSFGRIQFTPDTLPSDVTGVKILNMKTGEFEFKEGAIMKQMILADEINRTSPKTQASLLEAMAEGAVTVDDVTYKLPEPFMVIATQNPSGFVGTYPLPEAQLDRFMMKLSIGYPDTDTQMRLTRNQLEGKTADTVESVLNASDIIRMKEEAGRIKVVDPVLKYASDIIDNTRNEKGFTMGASPRAMIMLIRASQAKAYMEGRDHVTPDDIKAVSVNVLHHRVSLSYEAKARRENIDSLIYSNVLKAKVPFD